MSGQVKHLAENGTRENEKQKILQKMQTLAENGTTHEIIFT